MAVVDLFAISDFFSDDLKQLKRGENAMKSGHVMEVKSILSSGVVSGVLQASRRDKGYKVKVYFTDEKAVDKAECECPRGQVKCHHIAALLIWVHQNLGSTDVKCQWKGKSKATDRTGKKVSELYPHPKPDYEPLDRPVGEEDVDFLRDRLGRHGGNLGLQWLLSSEPVTEDKYPAKLFDDVVKEPEYLFSTKKADYVLQALQVTPEQISAVSTLTVGQRVVDSWMLFRKGRLTASNFGVVLSAIKRNRFPPSLFKRLMGGYNLSGVQSVQYGIAHEADAVQNFEKKMGVKTTETGLFLHETGLLGASPDRLVGDDCVLEIKCLFSCRKQPISSQFGKSNFPLIEENGQLTFKQDHDYYHQVQGQLYLTNRNYGTLALWTPTELTRVTVQKDPLWGRNLDLLVTFYKDQLLPKLLCLN